MQKKNEQGCIIDKFYLHTTYSYRFIAQKFTKNYRKSFILTKINVNFATT